MSLCWLICFEVPNDDTDEPETRGIWNECERDKQAESFVFSRRKHTILLISLEITSIFSIQWCPCVVSFRHRFHEAKRLALWDQFVKTETLSHRFVKTVTICTDEIPSVSTDYKTRKIHHPPPSTLMTSIGSVDFISIEFCENGNAVLFFLPPPPTALVTLSSLLFPSSCIQEIQIFHPDNVFTIHSESFYTLRQYELRIRNQCNSIGIAVISTAHTLRRATLFPQWILLKIRADKQKKKKKKKSTQRWLTMINKVLIGPPFIHGEYSFFFFFFGLLLVRGGGAVCPPCPPPPGRYATVAYIILPSFGSSNLEVALPCRVRETPRLASCIAVYASEFGGI